MDDKTTTRRIIELIALVTIVACVVLVLVELAANVRGELSLHRSIGVAHTVRRSTILDELRQNLGYGARRLRRSPGFTVTALRHE